ncbi:hypothetical protein C2U70_27050 [Bradyrhizobium guangdongense]|nr:hypothetical protein C2U70_27050 [Bradyrhizobium guangdongense]
MSRSLELFSAVLAAGPNTGEPYRDAAATGAELARNLEGVGKLYATHCADLGIASDECPSWARHDRFVRDLQYTVVESSLGALKFDAGTTALQLQTAEALRAVGRRDLAWSYLRRAIELGAASRHDELRIARLLVASHGIGDANDQLERLKEDWRGEVADIIADEAPEPDDVAPDPVARVERMVALTLTGLVLGGREPPEAQERALLAAVLELVRQMPGNGPAHLAAGFAAVGVGEIAQAQQLLTTASWLWGEARPAAQALSNEVMLALAWARAFLLDASGPSVIPGVAPSIDERLLKIAHARTQRAQGAVFQALDLYDEAAAGYLVRHPPMSYDFYKGYKIVAHEGRYYAVPGSVHEFIIVDGVVCGPSRAAQYARLRMPRWVANWLRGLARAGRLRGVWSLLQTVRRKLYAVRGVKIADDLESLLASIDSLAPGST